mgnify:CR=1 FL=1
MPAFERELERSRTELLNGTTGLRQVSQMRFHAALHRRGPIGIKETHVAKVNGREVYHALLLCERNGYFIRFTVTYPKELQQQIGLTYTDVAHFVGWPSSKN